MKLPVMPCISVSKNLESCEQRHLKQIVLDKNCKLDSKRAIVSINIILNVKISELVIKMMIFFSSSIILKNTIQQLYSISVLFANDLVVSLIYANALNV